MTGKTSHGVKALIIAGANSGAGKTTVSIGLMAALKKRGFSVQPFKVGPDYIDPSYHALICKRPSYNLDTWMMGVSGVKKTFTTRAADADIGIIEGVMGLFDGKDGKNEEGSTAHVAKVLGIPVVLVVDARSMARSAGALVYGFEKFDPKVKIAGVIFNRVGSGRHFQMLKQAIESRCEAKVLGYLPKNEKISFPERHLGLVMPEEAGNKSKWSGVEKRLAGHIEKIIDVDKLLKISSQCAAHRSPLTTHHSPITIRIAVAKDAAFCFTYQENLDMLKEFGAELVFFSPLKDMRLPQNIHGIYLGGGYPELYAKQLEANARLRNEVKAVAERGSPVFAECGGLMYLGRGLKDSQGKFHSMAGVFPWTARMLEKRKSLGYREIKVLDNCPFLKKGEKIRGHEYHYSEISNLSDKIKRTYLFTAHHSPLTEKEGYAYKNTLASYIHLHFASNPNFAEGFVKKCFPVRGKGGRPND